MKFSLLLCCHNKFEILPPEFIPIQCGSLINTPVDGAIRDDAGTNISIKNREYCELTAHYFSWNNIDADWYGFCHYRRFFYFADNIKKPYIVRKKLFDRDFNMLGNEQQLKKLCDNYDIIVTKAENMGITAREHYCSSKYHYKEDLDCFLNILSNRFPYLKKYAEDYLSQNKQYFCNMFIMKKDFFNLYCTTLFSILKEFDKHKTKHGDYQSDRTDGYLGEIFTGIFITYMRECGTKIKEFPRVDVGCTAKKIVLYYLFPPESSIRFMAKKIFKTVKGNYEA